MMLRCMSPKMALRDILRRRAILVVIGSIADIGWQPGRAVSVANDPELTPKASLSFFIEHIAQNASQPRSFKLRIVAFHGVD